MNRENSGRTANVIERERCRNCVETYRLDTTKRATIFFIVVGAVAASAADAIAGHTLVPLFVFNVRVLCACVFRS